MWVWMVLTLFTLVGEWHCRCYGCLEEERIGLLEIKSSIHPYGFSLIDWVDTSNESISNCCEWRAVECDNTTRRVIQLTLPGVRDYSLGDLVLNASLFLPFKELRSLDLSNNAIVGCHENQVIILLTNPALSEARDSQDLIDEVCRQMEDYGFCNRVFHENMESPEIDHVGLTAIAMEQR
ncbi:hypothetical protein DKX38_017794 [Salix brachista]|uniref:Leucine-rich repeat-containing N-terminal plant-type domain-containing protein n=1 Tax=Salix brachista TaxID=2182728 RepID=A0A5N5KX74_9ROSI|nr:hypothetical protein DKX38_017794 [Salix brachista]